MRCSADVVTEEPVEVVGIQADRLDVVWPVCEPMLAEVLTLSEGRLDTDSLYRMLKEKQAQLWSAIDSRRCYGFLVTSISEHPTGRKVLEVNYVNGFDMARWVGRLVDLEAWALEQGCDAVEIHGRPGWGRVTGYRELYRVFVHDLKGDEHGRG